MKDGTPRPPNGERLRIDHDKRTSGVYDFQPGSSDETRRVKSERMKEFNRKTGKVTLMGNMVSRRARKPK